MCRYSYNRFTARQLVKLKVGAAIMSTKTNLNSGQTFISSVSRGTRAALFTLNMRYDTIQRNVNSRERYN